MLALFTDNVKKSKQIYVTKFIPKKYKMTNYYFLSVAVLHWYVTESVRSKSTIYNLLVDLQILDISE